MSTSATTPALLHKSLGVEGCKVIDAEHGIVEAYVSGIGNKDSGGDIIIPGAFDNSLRIRKPKGVWSHDWDKPVSKTLEIYEVAAGDSRLPLKMQLAGIGGLYVKTQFNMNTQLGRDAYETVRFYGDEAEWSIGYQVHDAEFDQKMGAMILKEIELYEYSPVLFGMNALTSTVSIKVHKSDDGELEYDINGLNELESKAVSAALKVILEEKQVTVDSEEKADEYSEKPWHIEKRNEKYCVIKDSDGTNE
ncbi:MAG: HK97 family phage prohead protease, partial [bacterium]